MKKLKLETAWKQVLVIKKNKLYKVFIELTTINLD